MGLLKQIELGRIQNRLPVLGARVTELVKMIRVSKAQQRRYGSDPTYAIVVRQSQRRLKDAQAELDAIEAELAEMTAKVASLSA